ncbi:hypothetical protein [Croceivirga radicis]|uniref:hypothetical protein n=1 Tax=Croceivirga radicis TaxID=1929488 RepID=UPI000255AFCB|nr:hypothetical protein [Croceivirga radicis]
MFGIFKKKPKELPNFEFLKNYQDKEKYFIRTMQWDWLDDKMIHAIDNKSPRMITMGEWPQQIFLDADGQKTIEEYVIWMANQFSHGKVPENFDESMILTIEDLIADGEMLRLVNEKTKLPYYLEKPKSKQDIDKAHALMVEDGYLKKE